MHRTIRAVLVLVSALLLTSSHAQTSSNDLRQFLLDYSAWYVDVVNVSAALVSAYASPPSHSSETVVFTASALSADMRLKALSATTTAWGDLPSRYVELIEDVAITVENVYLVNAVNRAYLSLVSIREPLRALIDNGVPADEWQSAYRNFDIYGELSNLWKNLYLLDSR